MLRFALLAALVAGCGGTGCGAAESVTGLADAEVSRVGVAPELAPYVGEFRLAMARRGLGTVTPRVVRFAELPDPLVGWCEPGARAIQVHARLAAAPASLRAVVYHELGHCGLGLGHDPEPDHLLSRSVPLGTERWTDERWELELDRVAAWAGGGAAALTEGLP